MKITDKKWKRILLTSAAIVVSLLVILLLKTIMGNYLTVIKSAIMAVAIPAAAALFISYLIRPIKKLFDKKIKNKSLTTLLTIIIFVIILLGFLSLVGFILTEQVTSIVQQIQNNWGFISNTLKEILPNETLNKISDVNGEITFQSCFSFVKNSIDINLDLINSAVDSLSVIISAIITIFMTPVFLFFILRDGKKISSAILSVAPKKISKDTNNLAEITNVSIEKYFKGKLTAIGFLSIVFSTLFSIVLCIVMKSPIGILYGVMFGILLAVLDLIPYVGPTIGTILPMLFTLIYASETYQLILFPALILAANFAGQQTQSSLIEPLVMSKEVDIHPMAIFSGILFFGALFGIVGVILATPICATIKSSYLYFKDKERMGRNLEINYVDEKNEE